MIIDHRKPVGLHNIPVFVLIILILAFLYIRTVFELLIETLYTLDVEIIPLDIAYVAARTHILSKEHHDSKINSHCRG
jgi:hypothetical protein